MQENKRENQQNETKIHLTDNSTLQTPEEHQHDQSAKAGRNDQLDVSTDDLRQSDADRFAGSDRAGTAERKDNTL